MPNYDMHCSCGYTGEHQFSSSTPRENFPHCPECDSVLVKSIQAFSIGNGHSSQEIHSHPYEDFTFFSQTGEKIPGRELEFVGVAEMSVSDKVIGYLPAAVRRSDIQARNKRKTRISAN